MPPTGPTLIPPSGPGTPPRLATKQEIVDLSLSPSYPIIVSPFRPSIKRKHAPSPRKTAALDLVIDLISPPHSRAKIEPDSKPHIPSRIIQPESGKIRRGAEFETLDEAIHAIYSHQEEVGHKWVFGQSYKTDAGVLTKRTLRCNRYRNATPTHRLDIDPSDYRQGKSAKTQCKAHVNVNRLPASTKWYLSLVDLQHNHEREIPIGGAASRPPTQEHRDVVARFSESFSRQHISKVLCSELRLDDHNVVIGLWWQSPLQSQLTRRYPDILLADNSYNRNDKQYPLNIGIIIDSHGKSRNGWYAFQKKEDTETHAWILRCHLQASGGVHSEVLISDRDPALIAAVALVLVFTFHVYCLSHLLENIDKNLRRALGGDWQNFQHDFWAAYRAVSPTDYLQELYTVRDRWAWAWISHLFTAGIRTNGRVETENRVTKALGGAKKTLFQLFTALNERSKQQTGADLIRSRESSRRQHPGQIESLFTLIMAHLREYVGPFALSTSFKQMELSVFYQADVLQLPEGTRNWVRLVTVIECEH
ncbi:hypothetical protein C8R44DRAFT_643740 [Mycena epipterygia]|nr:hypothetical protein C8R44DRAFT_643740 [Mycena epipterygia]